MTKKKAVADEAPKNSTIEVDPHKLRELFADLEGHQHDISSATGKKRSALKEYYKDTGQHKEAVAIIVKINNMTEGSRTDCLRSLMPLLAHMNQTLWAKQQPDFLDE